MDQQQWVRGLSGALVPLGLVLVGLSIPNRPVGLGLGGVATLIGGVLYWTVDSWWPRFEQWGDPETDFSQQNTLGRGLVQLALTVVEFGVVLGGLLWLGHAIPVSPARGVPASAAIAGGVGLGAALPVVVARVEWVRQRTDTRLGVQATSLLPVVVFALLLLGVPGSALIFATSYIGSRLVTLPALYLATR
jgi:hypothetical protein